LIIEGETPKFLEKLKTTKFSLVKNLSTEELLAEMEKSSTAGLGWTNPANGT
jgi:hypothetical protein